MGPGASVSESAISLTAFLREHPLFQALSAEAMAHLLNHAELVDFGPAHAITREGAPAEDCFVLVEGLARASRTRPNGAQEELARLGPGGVFGLVGFVGQGQRPCTYAALAPSKILCLRSSVLDAAPRSPEVQHVLALRELLALALQSQLRVANEHLVHRAATVRATDAEEADWESLTHGGWKAPAKDEAAD